MVSVTQRIAKIKQPRGGYVPPRTLAVVDHSDGLTLHAVENISPIIVGIVTDYLTRIAIGQTAEEAFRVSLRGAAILGEDRVAKKLIRRVKGLDPKSVRAAAQLSGFDVVARGVPMGYKPVEGIDPDAPTIENIKVMVERNTAFLAKSDPLTMAGFTFLGGYSDTVTHGDGDILTTSTLLDFKVSKNPPTKENTLQLLMYLLMGKRSVHPQFESVERFEIFNARLHRSYSREMYDLTQGLISEVERDVIGYDDVA